MRNGAWPKHRTDILDWLIERTSDNPFVDNIFVELCQRLRDKGTPVARGVLYLDSNHPQWMGASITWRTGLEQAEMFMYDYSARSDDRYFNSPVHELLTETPRIRRRLDRSEAGSWYPIYDELVGQGMTDYAAWTLQHTHGKRHTVTFASDAPAGFSERDLEVLDDLMAAFALVSEIRLKNRVTRTILETYVGPHASEQILAGATTRGSGETVHAAILICDLRDFTTISDLWPRDDVIELLNGYFDAMCDPIERHGGEILKFMGDGLLAIFPLSDADACGNLIKAVEEARHNIEALNEANRLKVRSSPLDYGIGVHVGDVMYGNIGSKKRLDFTVIGPAVNIAARLEALTKTIRQKVVFSGAFVARSASPELFEALGSFSLKGVQKPVDAFASIVKTTAR
jgi:adenylate cyclase